MQAKVFQCPCCGAPLTFGAESQQLDCASCGNTYPLEALEQAQSAQTEAARPDDMTWQVHDNDWSEDDKAHLKAYRCSTCGSEIVADESTVATECVYCGNPSIFPTQLEGAFKPDGVIPFKKTKKEAQEAYVAHCKGKKLLPRLFLSEGRVEKLTGVYVPFWLFSSEADADMTYKATQVSSHRQGQYMVTRTRHYMIRRGGTLGFRDVPVDGSSKLDDTLMESVEPFDSGKVSGFDIAYLSGYQAERHDVDADACVTRANERIKRSVESVFRDTVMGYATVVPSGGSVRLGKRAVKQILMPVWLLNTKYRDKMYTFAMNAQTGRLIGDLPVDKGLFLKWLFGLFLALGVGGLGIAYLLMATGVI